MDRTAVSDLKALERACRRLEVSVGKNKEELRKLQKERQKIAKAMSAWTQGAVRMLCLWGGDLDAVTCWCETSGLDKVAIGAVMKKAGDMHAASTPQERIHHAEQPLPKCCTKKRSAKLIEERDLYSWVCKQNVDKGLAPHCSAVHVQRLARIPSTSEKPASMKKKHIGQWCRRFRRRWKICLGRIACRDTITTEEAKQKAISASHLEQLVPVHSIFCRTGSVCRGLVLGSHCDPQIWSVFNNQAQRSPH